jgi:hypothetical protein
LYNLPGLEMDFRRLAIALSCFGAFTLAIGIGIWWTRLPKVDDFRAGYYQCLWSSTYQVPRSKLIAQWQSMGGLMIDRNWDPNNASCENADGGWRVDFAKQAERDIARINGVAYDLPNGMPFFRNPPFLNGSGIVMLMLGGLIFFASAKAVNGSIQPPTITPTSISFDRDKWAALVKYDEQIAAIASKLEALGEKWVDEFAQAYLELNDKSYLPNIVKKIIAEARKEDEEQQHSRK